MFGMYAWNAGAVVGEIQQDIVALVCGAAVAALSGSCNKDKTAVEGAPSGFTVVDQPFGVMGRAGQVGGPGMLARVTLSTAPRIQVAAIDQWSLGTHAATYVTGAQDCSGLTSAAGSINIIANDAGLLIASSDWATWVAVGEVKRDGPALLGDAAAPGGFIVGSGGYTYMPRLKSPSAMGDVSNVSVTLASAFGTLSTASARNRAESLYLPMAPATLAYSSIPVGEIVGLVMVGGYGQGGDYVLDADGNTYQIVKYGYNTTIALPRA